MCGLSTRRRPRETGHRPLGHARPQRSGDGAAPGACPDPMTRGRVAPYLSPCPRYFPAAAWVLRSPRVTMSATLAWPVDGGAGLRCADLSRRRPGHQFDRPLRVRAQRRTRAAAGGRTHGNHPAGSRHGHASSDGTSTHAQPQAVDLAVRPVLGGSHRRTRLVAGRRLGGRCSPVRSPTASTPTGPPWPTACPRSPCTASGVATAS